jgi:hypothetical protein
MISPANALKWSMWLAATHPQAFKAVLQQVGVPRARSRSNLGGPALKGTFVPRDRTYNTFARGRFGTLGDDISPDVVTVETAGVDPNTVPTFDTSSITTDPTLQDINVNLSDVTPNVDLGQAAAATDTSGGFWSSIGSGLSSVGSGLASAVTTVAGAIMSPQALGAAGNLAATVIKANAASAQSAQMQQAVLQSQLARTATGAGAAPIRYMTNPATGQTVPYYYNAATGQYQPTAPGFFSALTGSIPGASSVTAYLPYILIGGGVLLVVAMMRR